jgi:hypothetical protein
MSPRHGILIVYLCCIAATALADSSGVGVRLFSLQDVPVTPVTPMGGFECTDPPGTIIATMPAGPTYVLSGPDAGGFAVQGNAIVIGPSGASHYCNLYISLSVTTAGSVSPDGSIISNDTGTLMTAAGTWSFGGPAPGRPGEWLILLNGSASNGGVSSKLEVAHGGQIYALTAAGSWWIWQNGRWAQTSAP